MDDFRQNWKDYSKNGTFLIFNIVYICNGNRRYIDNVIY